MSSTFKVPLTTIREILPHTNAERLEIAVVYGFHVVAPKGRFTIGDKVVYVPIDSILCQTLEDKLFPPDSKIKLNKHRIRQIKIRSVPSQGMLIDPREFDVENFDLETDLKENLGITKFEPPVRDIPGQPGRKAKAKENPEFSKYGGLDNIKWYPEKFKSDTQVVLQEKIHGCNARAAVMPFAANTLWKKIKRYFGLTPATEFCYGSNNQQLQNRPGNTGFYGVDIWGKVFSTLNVKDKLKLGETIFGEIYGDGVQKNYNYGLKSEHKFLLFDVTIKQEDGNHKFLNPDEVAAFAKERSLDMVPEIYRGPYQNLEFIKTFTKGASFLAPVQKIREGVVVKTLENYDLMGVNQALKVVSEDYLADQTNTDFH